MNKQEFLNILDKYLNGSATKQEEELLFAYYNSFQQSEAWNDELAGPAQVVETTLLQRLKQSIQDHEASGEMMYNNTPVRRLFTLRKVAAAAAILIMLSASIWYFLARIPKAEMAKTENTRAANQQDVAPGGNKAILTLADNSTIILDSAANGQLTQQGKTTVIKSGDGKLVYNAKALTTDHAPLTYNTLTTPRGGQYQLILPDGSKVWLNAASSITYPTAFVGKERKVTISGEAYFEVAPVLLRSGQKMPFLVQQGDMTVQVLGTHFNVNGYDNEAALMTTLLEGSVRVTKGSSVTVLKPGEQAVAGKAGNNNISVVNDPDITEVMAWKNGQFAFNDATIESIMHQVERWYDVEIVYDAKVSKHFIANIPRSVPLSELLKLLELTDQVHFKIQGRKITVLP